MTKVSWKRFSIDLMFLTGALVAVAVLLTPTSQPAPAPPIPQTVAVEAVSPPPAPPAPLTVPPRPRRDQIVSPKFSISAEDRDARANVQLLELTADLDSRPTGQARVKRLNKQSFNGY